MKFLNLKNQFPILGQKINGKPLVYLDNAATTQKPQTVINAVSNYYKTINSNVHRGVHTLSDKATDAFELVREKLRYHINAKHNHEVIFTKGTTESINIVAHGFRSLLKAGDEILVTEIEHHSNLVPWQMLASHSGAKLKYIRLLPNGDLDISNLKSLIHDKTKVVAFNHISLSLIHI